MLRLDQLAASTGVFNDLVTTEETYFRAHALAFIVARGCYKKRVERFQALRDVCEDLDINREDAISWFRRTAGVYEDFERAKLVITHVPQSPMRSQFN